MPILVIDAELALEVGERVLAAAEGAGKYSRRRFSKPLTLSIHVRLRQVPAGTVKLAAFEAPISGLTVVATINPMSVRFAISKKNRATFELAAPLPKNWKPGEDAVFSMTYEHQVQRVQAMSPGQAGEVAGQCDLGFVEGDVRPVDVPAEARSFVERVAVYVHERLLSPSDLVELPRILIEPPRVVNPD